MLARLRALVHHFNVAHARNASLPSTATTTRNMSVASATGAGTGTPAGSRAAVVNANPACCSIPPVLSSNYVPKGKYIKYAGFEKVYVTGPEKSDTAIVSVYDIFGCVLKLRVVWKRIYSLVLI